MEEALANLKIIFACLLIFLSFGIIGARLSKIMGTPETFSAYHPIYGWAVANVGTLLLAPWLGGGALFACLAILLWAGILMFSKDRIVTKAFPLSLFAGSLLLLPLLYQLCNLPVHLWDDASHWLPNAHFLFQYGRFPANDGPVHYSAWPAYPYGYTLLIAAVGWIMGHFVENVAPLLNVLLMVLFAGLLEQHIKPNTRQWYPRLAIFVLLFLAITIFNPGLFTLILFSSYAEYATAVILGFLLYAGWQYVAVQRRDMLIGFAASALVFVLIKQANVFLLAMMTGALWITSQRKLSTLKMLLLACLPALAANGIWELYKAHHLPGLSFGFKSFGEWQWYYIPALFHGMLEEAEQSPLYFALLIALIGIAIASYFQKTTALMHLIRSFAVVTVGYFIFLTLAYIGSRFADWEITSAASFFRYMSQLQCAAIMIVVFWTADYVRKYGLHEMPAFRAAAMLCVALMPIVSYAVLAYPMLEQPQPKVQETRDYAHAIFPKMPPQGKIGLIGSSTDGFENALIRLEWCQMASPQFQPALIGYTTHYTGENTAEGLKRFAERFDAVMVAPYDVLAAELFHVKVSKNWMSFKRTDKGWDPILP